MSKELRFAISRERDSIDGNLNRMCVCDDMSELEKQLIWSVKRALNLYDLNKQRFREELLGVE